MMKWFGAFGVLVLVLAACGGGGGGTGVPVTPTGAPATGAPTPTPGPTATATLAASIDAAQGATNGAPGAYAPASGNTNTGGTGANVDGIPCQPTMSNSYHIHAFAGVLVNGNWVAMPTAVGMVAPGAAVNGFVNTANCFYFIHTHDSSGIIHIESTSTSPLSTTLFTLGNVLDVWGQTITASSFASWTGAVRVFTATVPLHTESATTGYSEYTGDPRAIALSSHEAIWIEIGSPYVEASQLPAVSFYTEY